MQRYFYMLSGKRGIKQASHKSVLLVKLRIHSPFSKKLQLNFIRDMQLVFALLMEKERNYTLQKK